MPISPMFGNGFFLMACDELDIEYACLISPLPKNAIASVALGGFIGGVANRHRLTMMVADIET